MTRTRTWLLTLIFIGFAILTLHSQETESLDEGTIAQQFEFVEKKSGNYRDKGVRYEVIRLIRLNKLRQNVLDSINQRNRTIAELQATIAKNKGEIVALKTSVEQTSDELKKTSSEKDTISFFGGQPSKGTYKAIMWGVVFFLLLLLLFFIYRFRNSNFLTQQAKAALAELEQDYEEHRRRALEREQKVSRLLQDELNKNKKTI